MKKDTVRKNKRAEAILWELGLDRDVDDRKAFDHYLAAARLGDLWSRERLYRFIQEKKVPADLIKVIEKTVKHSKALLLGDGCPNVVETVPQLTFLAAKSVAEALPLIAQHPDIRLLFIDGDSRTIDALQFIKNLRSWKALYGVPSFIFTTKNMDEKLAREFAKLQVTKLLLKPLDAEKLLTCLEML